MGRPTRTPEAWSNPVSVPPIRKVWIVVLFMRCCAGCVYKEVYIDTRKHVPRSTGRKIRPARKDEVRTVERADQGAIYLF